MRHIPQSAKTLALAALLALPATVLAQKQQASAPTLGIDTTNFDRSSPPARRFLPLRERLLAHENGNSSRRVHLGGVQRAHREEPHGDPWHSRGRRQVECAGRHRAPQDRRPLRKLHGFGARRAARHRAAPARARHDWRSYLGQRTAGNLRAPRAARRCRIRSPSASARTRRARR